MSDRICGRNTVLEALRHHASEVTEVLVAGGLDYDDRLKEIKKLSDESGVDLREVSRSDLSSFASTENHQGVAARVTPLVDSELKKFMQKIPAGGATGRVMVLDQVQDPVNLGKIIRSSLYFGVDGLIKTQHHSAPLTPIAVKTSSGAAFKLPLVEVTNLQRTFSFLEEAGYWTVGTVLEADQVPRTVPRDRSLACVMGSEGEGLRRLTRELCDYLVRIPGGANFDSLNVASAAAVMSYALRPPGVEGE